MKVTDLKVRDIVGHVDLSQESLNTVSKSAADKMLNNKGDYKENLKKYFQNSNYYKEHFPKDHAFLEFNFLDHTRGIVYSIEVKSSVGSFPPGVPTRMYKSFYTLSTYMFIQSQSKLIPVEVSKSRFDFLANANLKLFLHDEYCKESDIEVLKEDYEPDIEKLRDFVVGSFSQLSYLDFESDIVKNILRIYISARDKSKCDFEARMIEYDVHGDGLRTLIASLVQQSNNQTVEEEFQKIILEGVCKELLKCVTPESLIQI